MPSPVKHRRHGKPHLRLSGWIAAYMAATPHLDGSDNTTVLLDNAHEVQPDILLRLEPERGGRSRVGLNDYITGAAELIVEVAASSASYDLHDKKRVYAHSGVREYLVVLTYEQAVRWFVLRTGEYEELAPAADGILRSEIFPGLWLDPAALWRQDLAGLLAVLQAGLATPEHAAFVAQLIAAQP